METLQTVTQCLSLLESHHFTAVTLIAIVAVFKWPPKG